MSLEKIQLKVNRRGLTPLILVTMLAVLSSSCNRTHGSKPTAIRLDYAYYNPVSLVLKNKGFLEQDLAADGISVKWTRTFSEVRKAVLEEFFQPETMSSALQQR
jgi:predicted PilT family ATPase